MTQVIDVPGQGPVEFPDDMNDEQIAAAIKRTLLQAPNAQQRRMGIREPRVKDERLAGNIWKAPEEIGYDTGGWVTDKTGSPGLGAAANVASAMATDPLTYLGGGLGKLVIEPTKSLGRSLMQKALKPTLKDLKLGKSDRAAQTLLDEGLNVTRGGVESLRTMGTDLNKAVDDILKKSGATVDKNNVASRLQDEIAKIEKSDWTPSEGRAAVEKVYDAFLGNPLVPKDIPLAQAQRLKQGIYSKLKDKYGTLGSETEEAMKAGARGFKEEIEAAAPGVAPLNARASEIWNALNVTERRALMAGNNQVGGITWLAHNPWAWSAAMADRSSFAQSILARLLHSGVAPNTGGVGAGVGGGVGELMRQQGQQ